MLKPVSYQFDVKMEWGKKKRTDLPGKSGLECFDDS
jgi:hypothetical protein